MQNACYEMFSRNYEEKHSGKIDASLKRLKSWHSSYFPTNFLFENFSAKVFARFYRKIPSELLVQSMTKRKGLCTRLFSVPNVPNHTAPVILQSSTLES